VPVDVASKMQHVADNVSKSVAGTGNGLLSVTRPLRPGPETVAAIAPDQAGTQAALSLSEHDFTTALNTAGTPALVLWGSTDQFAPVRTGQFLDCRLRGAHLMVLAGIGHVPMSEAADRTLSAVLAHLDASIPAVDATCPPAPPSVKLEEAPDAHCERQADYELSGVYDEVRLVNCRGARLHDVLARRLVLENSTVTGTSVRIEEGVSAVESRLELTGATLGGAVALDANRSVFDFAGVELPDKKAIRIERRSTFLMSHCTVGSADGRAPLHGSFALQPGKTF
jgi:hypothetical protein